MGNESRDGKGRGVGGKAIHLVLERLGMEMFVPGFRRNTVLDHWSFWREVGRFTAHRRAAENVLHTRLKPVAITEKGA